MHNIDFPGARTIGKPPSWTDEQCSSIQAAAGKDTAGYPTEQTWADDGRDLEGIPFWVTAWMPSREDLEALNAGRPLWLKHVGSRIQPLLPFTLNAEGQPNW